MGSKHYVCCHPESVENPFFEKRDFQAVQDLAVRKICVENPFFEKRDFQAVQDLAVRKILPALLKLRC